MTKPSVPFAKGRKACIFCGGTPVDREHLWAEWLHPLLPANKTHFRKVMDLNKRTGSSRAVRDFNRQGAPSTIRIRRVCRNCNSGWMSAHEVAVRPILEPMVRGSAAVLNADHQRMLTEYFTYKMMVADWEESPIVSEASRNAFFTSRTIPKNTQIYLFRCGEPPWRLNLLGHAVGLWYEDASLRPQGSYNTKSFAMGMGDLFVMIIFAPDVEGCPRLRFQPGLSAQLHPFDHDPIRWPPLVTISAEEANECANSLWNIDEFPGFKQAEK